MPDPTKKTPESDPGDIEREPQERTPGRADEDIEREVEDAPADAPDRGRDMTERRPHREDV